MEDQGGPTGAPVSKGESAATVQMSAAELQEFRRFQQFQRMEQQQAHQQQAAPAQVVQPTMQVQAQAFPQPQGVQRAPAQVVQPAMHVRAQGFPQPHVQPAPVMPYPVAQPTYAAPQTVQLYSGAAGLPAPCCRYGHCCCPTPGTRCCGFSAICSLKCLSACLGVLLLVFGLSNVAVVFSNWPGAYSYYYYDYFMYTRAFVSMGLGYPGLILFYSMSVVAGLDAGCLNYCTSCCVCKCSLCFADRPPVYRSGFQLLIAGYCIAGVAFVLHINDWACLISPYFAPYCAVSSVLTMIAYICGFVGTTILACYPAHAQQQPQHPQPVVQMHHLGVQQQPVQHAGGMHVAVAVRQ